MNQKGAVPVLILVAVIGLVSFLAISSTFGFKGNLFSSLFPKKPTEAAGGFLETFDGAPAIPQPFINDPQSANWDIAVQSRDNETWGDNNLEQFEAHHGPDCSPPIDASGNLITHHFDGKYSNTVFKCKDHVMTTISAGGYGVIYLTPNQIADWSNGEVVIKFDVTTLITSTRDWWDLWITPWEDNLQLPFDVGDVDLAGTPTRFVSITENNTSFRPFIGRANPNTPEDFPYLDGNTYKWWVGYDSFMKPSPKQRTTFELRLSKTHIRFGIPAGQVDEAGQPINGGNAFWWFDKDIAPMEFTSGIIQFGHHSYNPTKDCNVANTGYRGVCTPNTWHWDSVSISNSTPFTIIKADKRQIYNDWQTPTNNPVTFNQPAPANSFLRFSAVGKVELSFDNGATWKSVNRQLSSDYMPGGTIHPEHLSSYFTPIPESTTKVSFRFSADDWYSGGPYQAKDFAIWSKTVSTSTPAPSPLPSPPPSVQASGQASPSSVPSVSPTPGPLPGDIVVSGKVDIFDYNALLQDFGKTAGFNPRADIVVNGKIDIFDYNALLQNFGKTSV